MKKRWMCALSFLFLFLLPLSGCGGRKSPLNPEEPVTVTMWHNFGGTMQESMDTLVDEFNSTVGRDQGIVIDVTAIASSAELQSFFNKIAANEPGAPELPDITTSYPKNAVRFENQGRLADLNKYFSKKELEAYVPQFVEEGCFEDGLYVFPIAKSTEILYLNQTLFDRFSAETGVTKEALDTFEGLADVAQKYYDWTDGQTPDEPGDGKAFFNADSWLNLAQAGMRQQGGALFEGESLNLDQEAYARIWNTIYPPLVSGAFAIYDGYSSDLSKTGEVVCSTGSSAGVLFYGDRMTLPNGDTEPVEYSILPFPVFEGGKKAAIQRGNGMMVTKSDEAHEYASAIFLKWFTAPEQNMRFISSTGYLPVTKDAFENRMDDEISRVQDERLKKMLTTVTRMYREYDFFVAPTFENFDIQSDVYEENFKNLLKNQHEEWLRSGCPDILENQGETGLTQWKKENGLE